jgi:superfamily II DNA or RNA helicase
MKSIIDTRDEFNSFIERKTHLTGDFGFDPLFIPDQAFGFQQHLIEWSCRKGRAAVFADCGLGKTMMQLAWCENVVRKTNGNVLLLTPLAVGAQTVREAARFGMEAKRSIDGKVAGKITVTNYEKLHMFDPADFVGVCCDESSILKHVKGATQKAVTRFVCKMPYRSLWTATAAPNDYTELGTSSEALGGLNHSEMLKMFFKQMDQKTTDQYERKIAGLEKAANHFGKLSFRVSQAINGWRLKGHAHDHFWRWVCSWARACRKPSDLGFSDTGYELPPLMEREHIVTPNTPPDGMLFTMPAFGLKEERDERKRTADERCQLVADLVNHNRPAVIWCHNNYEGDALENMIPEAVQIAGRHDDEHKEAAYEGFSDGSIRVLITKPKIGAWGLNWQHCNHVVTFASHSYEQYYQSVRRCWRFGQENPVTVDIIASEGEVRVKENMARKASQADKMFSELVLHMNNSLHQKREIKTITPKLPSWI